MSKRKTNRPPRGLLGSLLRGLGSPSNEHAAQAAHAYNGANSTVSNMPVMCYGAINKIAQASQELAAARAHAWAMSSGREKEALLGRINRLDKKLRTIVESAQDRCKGSIR